MHLVTKNTQIQDWFSEKKMNCNHAYLSVILGQKIFFHGQQNLWYLSDCYQLTIVL